MKTGRNWDGSCCWGARKSCRRGGSTTRLKHCCALATLNYKQCASLPARSSRSVSNERGVGVTFQHSRPPCGRHLRFRHARQGRALSAPSISGPHVGPVVAATPAHAPEVASRIFIFVKNQPPCLNGQARQSRRPRKTGPPLSIRSPRCQLRYTELSRCPLPSHHFSRLAEGQTV